MHARKTWAVTLTGASRSRSSVLYSAAAQEAASGVVVARSWQAMARPTARKETCACCCGQGMSTQRRATSTSPGATRSSRGSAAATSSPYSCASSSPCACRRCSSAMSASIWRNSNLLCSWYHAGVASFQRSLITGAAIVGCGCSCGKKGMRARTHRGAPTTGTTYNGRQVVQSGGAISSRQGSNKSDLSFLHTTAAIGAQAVTGVRGGDPSLTRP